MITFDGSHVTFQGPFGASYGFDLRTLPSKLTRAMQNVDGSLNKTRAATLLGALGVIGYLLYSRRY